MTRRHHHAETEQDSSTRPTDARGDKVATSSDKYGVWSGAPTSKSNLISRDTNVLISLGYTSQTLQQDKSPHITLKFTSAGKNVEANINVASTSSETDLVYWMNRSWTHPLTKTLAALSEGFHPATSTNGTGLSLDYIRTTPSLLSFPAGQVVQDSDPSLPNDILSQLEPIIKAAISAKATVYIFGSDYGTGIDEVHMNQGNVGNFENVVGKDGALVFHYGKGDGHWEAVFLAFAEQEVPTDNKTGAPTSSAKSLESIAKGTSS